MPKKKKRTRVKDPNKFLDVLKKNFVFHSTTGGMVCSPSKSVDSIPVFISGAESRVSPAEFEKVINFIGKESSPAFTLPEEETSKLNLGVQTIRMELSAVNHPAHYGGKDNPYEAIKVIEAWELGFSLGNTVKYISRCGKKGAAIEDLEKAAFYLNREIENRKKAQSGS